MSDATQPLPFARASSGRGTLLGYGVWVVAAIVLVALPHIFSSGLSLTTMSLMGIMVIFALSYNMLLGQTGLLSFGHAVYFGLGGFLTAHIMNAVESNAVPLPLFVFPLAGGLAGLFFGVVFGAVSTRRGGTAFAMITLGIGELVASSALILRHAFGGEAGISTDRTDLVHLFGITFGPQIQVYYLIAAWCLASTAAMYALTRTPFGRICNAVRDNPERAGFIGYNTQTVRFLAFSFSGLFAGIAGGLAAINFELMSSGQLGLTQSGAVVVMTFIGGVGEFAGPIIGAILITYLQVTLSDVSDAWELYFGLLFIATVMFAPEGIAGLLARQRPLLVARQFHRVLPYYALALLPGLMALCGFVMVVEMTYQLTLHAPDGPAMTLFHIPFKANGVVPWAIAVGLLAVGTWLFRRAARVTAGVYGDALAVAQGRRDVPLSPPALEVANLAKSFGPVEIIRGVDLAVPEGERHAVIGPNGAGKSTLFHLISGRYRPSGGSIRLRGREIGGMAPQLVNRMGLSRSFQVTNIFPHLSVWENIHCATLWALGYKYSFWRSAERLADARRRTEEILAEINLTERWRRPAGVLTYAEQRALDIGLSIAGNADILLLDEPTAGMSHAETARMVALIRKVSENRTLLMIEHDMGVVFDLADRISVLVYGKVIASDTPERIKANAEVQQAYLGTEVA